MCIVVTARNVSVQREARYVTVTLLNQNIPKRWIKIENLPEQYPHLPPHHSRWMFNVCSTRDIRFVLSEELNAKSVSMRL